MAANTLAGFGFRGGQLYTSAASNLAMQTGVIAYNNTIATGFGDPVTQNSSGVVTGTATTFGTSGMAGIFRGCYYADSSAPGGLRFLPNWPGVALASSATVVTAQIEVDPAGVYLAQYQGTKLTQTNIGNTIDVVSGTAAAPNAGGISTCVLDATGALGTTALPFRIVGILGVGQYANAVPPTPSGNLADDNGWVFVKINNSVIFSSTTGV
jgi:hypothetical protein